LRARHIGLEVHTKTLEGRLTKVEKREQDLTKMPEKETADARCTPRRQRKRSARSRSSRRLWRVEGKHVRS